jgi:hypothetical protein
MYLSQAKAAKVASVSRGTIANRLSMGKLSITQEGIELSELMRCFDYITEDDITSAMHPGSNSEVSAKSPSTPANYLEQRLEKSDADAEWLRELVEKREDVIAEKERLLTEAQTRLDQREEYWQQQVNKLQALLPAPPAKKRRLFGLF